MKFILAFLFVFPGFAAPASPLKNFECERVITDFSPPASEISKTVAVNLEKSGLPKHQVRGYSILIATMLASAAATTYVTASLPSEFQFLSHFLAQVSTLGVYVFGSPIWEPLASKFRMLAFGVKSAENPQAAAANTELLEMWSRTQETYSLNAQMSRNLINSYLTTFQQNLFEAHRAMTEKNPQFAADQIALAAFRLRILFQEIKPEDPGLRSAVRASFTNHIAVDADFIQLVKAKIAALDDDYAQTTPSRYYERVVEAWLR